MAKQSGKVSGQVMSAFERSGKDKDKGAKEGSKKDTAMDKKQMKAMPSKKK